jgi:hypothetical protein
MTSVLEGVLLATYVRAGDASPASMGKATTGGALSFLAVGCPICNKLVVLAIGVSGTLSCWAPVLPFLAAASAGLLAFAACQRLRGLKSRPVRATPAGATPPLGSARPAGRQDRTRRAMASDASRTSAEAVSPPSATASVTQ